LFVIPEGNLRFSPVRLRSSGLNQTFPRANFALLRVPFFGAEEGAEKSPFCLRARLQPGRKPRVCNATSAAEVRFFATERLFPQPLKARPIASSIPHRGICSSPRTLTGSRVWEIPITANFSHRKNLSTPSTVENSTTDT